MLTMLQKMMVKSNAHRHPPPAAFLALLKDHELVAARPQDATIPNQPNGTSRWGTPTTPSSRRRAFMRCLNCPYSFRLLNTGHSKKEGSRERTTPGSGKRGIGGGGGRDIGGAHTRPDIHRKLHACTPSCRRRSLRESLRASIKGHNQTALTHHLPALSQCQPVILKTHALE